MKFQIAGLGPLCWKELFASAVSARARENLAFWCPQTLISYRITCTTALHSIDVFPAFAHNCGLCRLDKLILPVALQTKHLSRPLLVFLVAIARENTFVCVDHLQQARADTSDAKHESEPKCISYTQHSVSNLSILRAPVRREPEKFWGVDTAGRLIF